MSALWYAEDDLAAAQEAAHEYEARIQAALAVLQFTHSFEVDMAREILIHGKLQSGSA